MITFSKELNSRTDYHVYSRHHHLTRKERLTRKSAHSMSGWDPQFTLPSWTSSFRRCVWDELWNGLYHATIIMQFHLTFVEHW